MRLLIFKALLTALVFSAAAGAAQKHALLIGISHYIPGQGLDDLSGVGPDIDDMSAVLDRFGFPKQNVQILRDAAASKQGILDALDQLIARVSPGDYVFIYYSGHGTSPQDATSRGIPIDGDTGAIIPADYRAGTPQERAERLVVGRRDLRPRLEKLDGKATVFAILDTCFSANLMKAIIPHGRPRGVPASSLLKEKTRSMEDDIRGDVEQLQNPPPPEPYPYHSVGWISAALAGQEALDVEDVHATFDAKPHGALTNSILMGLQGGADLNHDGTISHDELFEYAQRQLMSNSSQIPAWSADSSNHTFPAEPALGGAKTLQVTGKPHASGAVRVQLEGDASALGADLENVPGVEVVAENGDLIVRAQEGGYRLYQPGGVPINEKPTAAKEIVRRIAAEPDVRRLVAWSYPQQTAGIEMALYQDGQRTRQGFFFPGQQFDLMWQGDREYWPLVLDVDTTGYVTVLYPTRKRADGMAAGDFRDLGANGVSCPCGIEFLKGFAFDSEPAGYEDWAGQSFEPSDPKLKQLLELAGKGRGEAVLRLITNSKEAAQ